MSAPGIGALGHCGVRVEYSYASGGAVTSWQPIDSEDIALAFTNIYGDRILASAEQVFGVEGSRAVAGGVTFGVSPQGPLEWWRAGLGQPSSPYSVERPLKSLLIEIDKETGCVVSSGDMVSSLAFSSTQGDELKCIVTIEGKDMSSKSAGGPTFTSGDAPFLHSEASFLLGGAEDTSVTAFSLTIDNSLATDLYGTNKQRVAIEATKLMVTGSFTKLFDDVGQRNNFLQAMATSFQATFTRGSRSFDINCPKIRYNTRPAPLAGQTEYILETFDFTAYVNDPDTEKSVEITVDQT